MDEEHLTPVPDPQTRDPEPSAARTPDPLPTLDVVVCPAPARAIIQKRIDAVRLAQRQLKETADAVAAGLGIDATKEMWNLDADRGVFTRAGR